MKQKGNNEETKHVKLDRRVGSRRTKRTGKKTKCSKRGKEPRRSLRRCGHSRETAPKGGIVSRLQRSVGKNKPNEGVKAQRAGKREGARERGREEVIETGRTAIGSNAVKGYR